ncbi:MAG: hypothetical protein J1E35_07045 [Lachnospiraceae bacterium]|nr:hypothetical protein [Lachnospiraceae bacterium]
MNDKNISVEMDDMYNSVDILDYLVNISFLANKWLMWCESNTPDKSVFVPSIFQMRDAYSHFMALFGKGLEDDNFKSSNKDFNMLFEQKYSLKQLEEAFTHSARAFYDCADYILLTVEQDVAERRKNKEKLFLDLRGKLIDKRDYINKLRSSKSKDMAGSYKNILNWDKYLQVLTSAYIIEDFGIDWHGMINEIKTKINFIESSFSEEMIKNHSPNFYAGKSKLVEIETLPEGLDKYLTIDDYMFNEVIENPTEWCKENIGIIEEKITKAKEYSKELDTLQRMMANTKLISKRNNIIKTVWGFISAFISWFATDILSSVLLHDYTFTSPDQTQSISISKINLFFLFQFVGFCTAIFFIGILIINIVFNRILKKHK